MKKLLYPFILFFSLCFLSANTFADEAPVTMLKSIANNMIRELQVHQATLKSNPSFVFSLADRLIVPHADLDEMAKRVLPPATWASATSEQKSRFKREFTTVLERTYGSALAEYRDQTVHFYPIRGGIAGKTSVVVNSQIVRSDGPSIGVDYRVVRKGSQWKLYDMTVEGVSMLESFRSQFADQLARGNISDLINTLASHNHSRGG